METRIVVTKADADRMIAVFTAKAHVELFDRFGPTASHFSYHPSYWSVTAYSHGEIAGLMLFSHEEKAAVLDVRMGYVRPELRRQGLYRQMWDALVAHARTIGVLRIWGGTHVRNVEMRAFWTSVGRPVEGVNGEYVIPQIEESQKGGS